MGSYEDGYYGSTNRPVGYDKMNEQYEWDKGRAAARKAADARMEAFNKPAERFTGYDGVSRTVLPQWVVNLFAAGFFSILLGTYTKSDTIGWGAFGCFMGSYLLYIVASKKFRKTEINPALRKRLNKLLWAMMAVAVVFFCFPMAKAAFKNRQQLAGIFDPAVRAQQLADSKRQIRENDSLDKVRNAAYLREDKILTKKQQAWKRQQLAKKRRKKAN